MSSERNQDVRGSGGQDDYSNNDSYGSNRNSDSYGSSNNDNDSYGSSNNDSIRMGRLGMTRTVATTRPLLMDHPTMIHTGVVVTEMIIPMALPTMIPMVQADATITTRPTMIHMAAVIGTIRMVLPTTSHMALPIPTLPTKMIRMALPTTIPTAKIHTDRLIPTTTPMGLPMTPLPTTTPMDPLTTTTPTDPPTPLPTITIMDPPTLRSIVPLTTTITIRTTPPTTIIIFARIISSLEQFKTRQARLDMNWYEQTAGKIGQGLQDGLGRFGGFGNN
ncbi:hypothetical protein AGABI1DRAFT_86533 [Agaricus bisporus var. burnettii JB137-S8]|uniref:Uncharacterized protein n=1 Tax=Agaricus bisporus var. burnettii (strain JB137-S8 / ATCC MYA-4627 / FGSC 10392) TaxID=597362 RepID=K5VT51_AGABU|nr:uncharacterized protein AGABI1DRAFT_86533 [Agaricus bisporus var. burnettii JB137-S8]EKM77609.1 hypothetical protein AGABI1DRAFT_86533 [Agaricus bisporus var. burnettii JB137-S8]